MSGGLPEGFSNLDDLWDGPPSEPISGDSDNTADEVTGQSPEADVDSRLYLPGWEDGWTVQL